MNQDYPPTLPDRRDWTVVIVEGCEECGYVPSNPHDSSARLAAAAAEWPEVLGSEGIRERPEPTVWSPLEYAVHARDMVRLLGARVGAMLADEDPVFEDWEGDVHAAEGRYWEADAAQIIEDIRLATRQTQSVLARVGRSDWERTGRRSDGRRFTVATLSQYLVHDVEHHLQDARLGLRVRVPLLGRPSTTGPTDR